MSEVFSACAADAAGPGFVLSHLARGDAPLLWIQDRLSRKEAGQPFLPGLPRRPVIRADLGRAVDVLWAMEEGLRCAALGMVVAEIWGDPRALDFTATKRLALRAEQYRVPCWLIRHAAQPGLSAARNRWRVAALPSQGDPHDPGAPGNPRWQVDLFRSRHMRPGTWIATHDRAANRVDLSAPVPDGALVQDNGALERRAAR